MEPQQVVFDMTAAPNQLKYKASIVIPQGQIISKQNLKIGIRMKDFSFTRVEGTMKTRNVEIDGSYYLDGGISDPIPVRQSMRNGNRKNVIIMTKEEGFVRQPVGAELALIRARYLRYPKVYELMRERHLTYNATVQFIEEKQKKGELFVIRPKQKSEVGRIEKDREKMKALYEEGYRDAQECYAALMEYLIERRQ